MSEIASGAAGSGNCSRPLDEAPVCLLVAAEQALDAGARRGHLHAKAHCFNRGQCDGLEEIGVLHPATSLCGERAGPGEQERDSRLGGSVIGHET